MLTLLFAGEQLDPMPDANTNVLRMPPSAHDLHSAGEGDADMMCGDETDAGETALETKTAFEFESYFDRGSGIWSLRRVPTTVPPKPDGGADEGER